MAAPAAKHLNSSNNSLIIIAIGNHSDAILHALMQLSSGQEYFFDWPDNNPPDGLAENITKLLGKFEGIAKIAIF